MSDFPPSPAKQRPGIAERCLCEETSPPLESETGVFHWRPDCPYLSDDDARACRVVLDNPEAQP